MNNHIHPAAHVDPAAELGSGNRIGPGVIVEAGVRLGDDNVLEAGAVLKRGTVLGHGNVIHEYAVIGGLPQDIHFDPATPSGVEIGDRNVLREYVTINRASQAQGTTRLGDDNYLMTQVHLGHDCVLGNRVIIAPGTGLGGFVAVADRAFLSGGVMVHQFVHVGRLAMVGGNAKITRDVLPFMITDGVPAAVHGLNRVGLRRAGFTPAQMKLLKDAYRLIHRSGESLQIILDGLEAMADPLAAELAAFIRGAERGFHREARSG